TLQSQVNKAAEKRLSLSGLEILHGRHISSIISAWAQLSSQSMGVLRFGPSDGAMTLPSGKITGSPPVLPVEGSGGERSAREARMSPGVPPGGGSSPPLRPHPATLSAATSAPIAAIRARRSSD